MSLKDARVAVQPWGPPGGFWDLLVGPDQGGDEVQESVINELVLTGMKPPVNYLEGKTATLERNI